MDNLSTEKLYAVAKRYLGHGNFELRPGWRGWDVYVGDKCMLSGGKVDGDGDVAVNLNLGPGDCDGCQADHWIGAKDLDEMIDDMHAFISAFRIDGR